MSDPRCTLCGHYGSAHHFASPVVCRRCPDRVCQDGEDGAALRRETGGPVPAVGLPGDRDIGDPALVARVDRWVAEVEDPR